MFTVGFKHVNFLNPLDTHELNICGEKEKDWEDVC